MVKHGRFAVLSLFLFVFLGFTLIAALAQTMLQKYCWTARVRALYPSSIRNLLSDMARRHFSRSQRTA